ncbi:MAG: ATP-binding cassette domain-containing protein [Rhodovulum sp.]
MPASDPILSVRDLAKTYHVHHLDTVVGTFDAVSFDLAPGEFLLVEGPNGTGKSTLLRTLWRSCVADSGSATYRAQHAGPVDLVTAHEVDVLALRRSELGFVTQFLAPRPRVTAERLVAEPLHLLGVTPEEATEQARAALADLGVRRELWSAWPSTFSGGEQQKVNLARSLIAPRRLLLLDEPTASLDRAARAALTERLAALRADGVALIGVLHHPEDVAELVTERLHLH